MRHNTPQCKQAALFLHSLSTSLAVIGVILLTVIAASLTCALRSITPGIATWSATEPGDVESTPIPSSTSRDTEDEIDDQPPPYQPPRATPTTNTSTSKIKRSPAHRFVCGTFIIAALLFLLLIISLCNQNILRCQGAASPSLLGSFVWWIPYTILCLWSTVGVGCWIILLRDLWGPNAKNRLPINEAFIAMAVVGSVGAVVIAPFWALGTGSVKAVEFCQRRCCGVELEDEDGEEEERERGVELEEGRASVGVSGEVEAESEDEEESENAGFLRNGNKG